MQTVYDFITTEEAAYQTTPVPVVEGYEWNMFEHIKLTTLYLNSQYSTGKEDSKPFRNIILPKINLEHRAVEFDLSEIEFYINSQDENYKALLVRKWHERWALQNNISDFLDKLTETYTDYGGVLLEDTPQAMGIVPFQRLAFCDQTDMMSGPICQRHQYSPDQLKEMEKYGWQNVDEVIALAREEKTNTQNQSSGSGLKAQTPGRYVDVYDLEGVLPDTFLNAEGDKDKFTRQLQVVTFYTDSNGKKQGITLFSGKKTKQRYKAFKRDEIYGRALGRGGVEELFEPQVWVNYNEIQRKELLDQVSKVLNWTDDPSFKANNDTQNLENGSVLTLTKGSQFSQVVASATNIVGQENAIVAWDNTAREIASAQQAIAGDETKSGMPFRLGALLNQESHSLHQYRKKRLGNFLSTEVYPDWILPKMMKEVAGGMEFLTCFSLDEMGELVDQIVGYQFNQSVIKKVLAGEIVWPEDAQALKETYRTQFFKTNRKFIKILEGELKDLPIEIEVNITGEQKNRNLMDQKLAQIWAQASQILMVNPNFFQQQPAMAKFFNQIVVASGFSPINFGNKAVQLPQLTQPNAQTTPVPAQAQAAVPSQPTVGG